MAYNPRPGKPIIGTPIPTFLMDHTAFYVFRKGTENNWRVAATQLSEPVDSLIPVAQPLGATIVFDRYRSADAFHCKLPPGWEMVPVTAQDLIQVLGMVENTHVTLNPGEAKVMATQIPAFSASLINPETLLDLSLRLDAE